MGRSRLRSMKHGRRWRIRWWPRIKTLLDLVSGFSKRTVFTVLGIRIGRVAMTDPQAALDENRQPPFMHYEGALMLDQPFHPSHSDAGPASSVPAGSCLLSSYLTSHGPRPLGSSRHARFSSAGCESGGWKMPTTTDSC
jgi:hypothetical protein